jgi:hypothetical protein
VILKNE